MDIPTVNFGGTQTIVNVEEACALLRAALTDNDALHIDLMAVTEADLAFAQLIIATRKSTAAAGKALSWRVVPDGPVATVLARAGLDSFNLLDAVMAEGGPQ
ncbi:MAG: STAS domain-containing protein [Rhodospirillaceae bacterium]|nr:STAS domain-containing protein [Rhodospirillales bacterium]